MQDIIFNACFISCVLSLKIPDLEGKPNLTSLDIQIKKLRDKALEGIMEGAKRLFEEATDVNKCLTVIEGWLEKLRQLAEEVWWVVCRKTMSLCVGMELQLGIRSGFLSEFFLYLFIFI